MFSAIHDDNAAYVKEAASLGRCVRALDALESRIVEFEDVYIPNLKKETLLRAKQYSVGERQLAEEAANTACSKTKVSIIKHHVWLGLPGLL